MQTLLFPLGLAVLVLTFTDLVMTTILLDGGGPLSSRATSWAWSAATWVNRRRPSHRFLSIVGVTIALAVIALWVLLFWVGWTMVFSSDPRSIIDSQSLATADLPARVYYVGFTIVTLGIGDFVPNGDVWEIMTALAAMSGYTVLGLSISYILSTVNAVVNKRRLASYVSALGRTSEEIVANSWNGSDFSTLQAHVSTLASMVVQLGENYLAYPVLHYFHSRETERSAPLSLASLDEALTILEFGVQADRSMQRGYFVPLRGALTSLLTSLSTAYIDAGREPPLPDLGQLRELGVPVVEEDEFAQAIRHLQGRRRLLMALVENDGWEWEVITRPLGQLAMRPERQGANPS